MGFNVVIHMKYPYGCADTLSKYNYRANRILLVTMSYNLMLMVSVFQSITNIYDIL